MWMEKPEGTIPVFDRRSVGECGLEYWIGFTLVEFNADNDWNAWDEINNTARRIEERGARVVM